MLIAAEIIENKISSHQLHYTTSLRLGLPLVFNSSFDKANRTSSKSFRLPSMDIDSEIIQPNDPVEDPNLTKGKVVNLDEGSSTQCEVCKGKVQLLNRSKLC
ncbi:hypothetical protein L2E82_10350 [Cichorium intybus]|uniref:Uncharacterized protein n=1 Tax=Cichorium intybus TaxID=13427 RepID=A0ACB9GBA9_CICIN|nr:hypothetical protein L2E82_10350 [Cichorium intybus]